VSGVGVSDCVEGVGFVGEWCAGVGVSDCVEGVGFVGEWCAGVDLCLLVRNELAAVLFLLYFHVVLVTEKKNNTTGVLHKIHPSNICRINQVSFTI